LEINDLQPNPTKSNNHFFISPKTTTVGQASFVASKRSEDGRLSPPAFTHSVEEFPQNVRIGDEARFNALTLQPFNSAAIKPNQGGSS